MTFDAKGRALLEQATQRAFKASGQLDVTNRLGWFVGLTSADLADWDQPGAAQQLTREWPKGGKLFTDPIVATVDPSGEGAQALTAAEIAPASSLTTDSG